MPEPSSTLSLIISWPGVHSATLAPVPTHVDDEAALVATLLGLWRASLVVLAAGRAAGLVA
eukprot:12328096-Alexandrium_andersonii.AAC.1